MKEIRQQLAEVKSKLVEGLAEFDQMIANERQEARLETLKLVKENCEKEVKALKLQAKEFEDVGAEPINIRAAITGLDIAMEIVDKFITQIENEK